MQFCNLRLQFIHNICQKCILNKFTAEKNAVKQCSAGSAYAEQKVRTFNQYSTLSQLWRYSSKIKKIWIFEVSAGLTSHKLLEISSWMKNNCW